MRRKDREIVDREVIEKIIKECECCRISLVDKEKDEAYIVPLNFGYEKLEDKIIFYFHGAKEGRKINLINKNNKASFQMDTDHKLNEAEKACGYSYRFASIMGIGKIFLINSKEEKIKALSLIMRQYTGRDKWDFEEKMLEATEVIKLEVEQLTCKVHG